jgi:hypothetical protein
MAIFDPAERQFIVSVSRLYGCNPFLPERIEWERQCLGDDFVEESAAWNLKPDSPQLRHNVNLICERSAALLEAARGRMAGRSNPSDTEIDLYEQLVRYVMYERYAEGFDQLITESENGGTSKKRVRIYDRFVEESDALLRFSTRVLPAAEEVTHLFACLFQVRRAYHNIFAFIIGSSGPTAGLRAAVWQSIFTHDLLRYRRRLYDRMSDYTTLVIGPSGTGKELVARAVGRSGYIPFDPKRGQFVEDA